MTPAVVETKALRNVKWYAVVRTC